MNRTIVAIRILSVMFVGIACLGLVPSLRAEDADSAQLWHLLSQARLEAIRLREDTNQMRDFVWNNVMWSTHAVYASMIIDDVAAMREKVGRLDLARNEGSAWQQAAIDELNPLMNEITTTSESVVTTMDRKPFDRSQYNEYLEANYDHAQHLAALISNSVRYSKEKNRLERARVKLHLMLASSGIKPAVVQSQQ